MRRGNIFAKGAGQATQEIARQGKSTGVARMSAAICGASVSLIPGCRFAHPGYVRYDSSGKVVVRSSTDSQGSTTNYHSRGKVISRESTSDNTTTIYDAGGRNVGRVTTNR
jgi:YD repeat-containing protein